MMSRLSAYLMLALLAFGAGSADAVTRGPGGMLAWPEDEMERALSIFIPDRMQALDVPGVAVVIVKDGRILYSASFGKLSRDKESSPLTPGILFEGGELGEAVTAYAAMRMVDDKLLFLDAPLARDLGKPWLSDPADSQAVTLRQILTHTSGLADNVVHPSRSTRYAPGTRFSYSGVGFLYLQHAMEEISHAPFERVMQQRVFTPLHMSSSTFLPAADSDLHQARGHVTLSYPLWLFSLPFAGAFIVILAATWAVVTFVLQRRMEIRDLLWAPFGGFTFASATLWHALGLLNGVFIVGVALLSLLAFAALIGLLYYLSYVAGLMKSRDGVISRGRSGSGKATAVITLGLAAIIAHSALKWPLAVPDPNLLGGISGKITKADGGRSPNVTLSFRTSADDMGLFMIDVMDGLVLGQEMRRRMLGECVEAAPGFQWCLGLGLKQNAEGNTLWLRGATLGFDNLMVMDPARRAGIIVLTNSRTGGELAQSIARNVLGIETVWALP